MRNLYIANNRGYMGQIWQGYRLYIKDVRLIKEFRYIGNNVNSKDISDVKDFKEGNLWYQKYEGYEIDLGYTKDNI